MYPNNSVVVQGMVLAKIFIMGCCWRGYVAKKQMEQSDITA